MANAEQLTGGANLMAVMGFEPDKQIDVAMLINARQLQNISESLLDVYPKSTVVGKRVTKVQELLQHLKVKEAAGILEDILLHSKGNAEMKTFFDELIKREKQFAEDTMHDLRRGEIPEYILQVPSISK